MNFDNILSSAVDLGKSYIDKEIADHGKKEPTTRPDPVAVPDSSPQSSPITPGLSPKHLAMIGGGVFVGVLALVLILKK